MRRIWATLICLSGLFQRHQRESELERELRGHLELEAEDQQSARASPQEAAYAARRALGNTTQIKEDVRTAWGFQWFETLLQDLRYGLRQLRRNPGFTIVAVLTLALGIGANTAIFTLIDATILKPLPYKQADRLVVLGGRAANQSPNGLELVHPTEYLAWRDRAQSFESLVLTQGIPVNTQGQDGAEQIAGLWTTPGLFKVFAVLPELGRPFTEQEARPGGNKVAILSYGYWQRRFGKDPTVIGRTIRLDGEAAIVIGVMPAGFRVGAMDADIYLPMPLDPANPEAVGSRSFQCYGRLRQGVSISSAQAEMNVIEHQLQRLHPKLLGGWGVAVLGLHDFLTQQSRPALLTLLGAVFFVLAIACANLAGLLLARGNSRRGELAVRTALGASRRRLLRQLTVESLLLSAAGGAAGLILGLWISRLVVPLVEQAASFGPFGQVHLDVRVLVFTLSLSLLTAIFFGPMPAFEASQFDVMGSLKERGSDTSNHRRQRRLQSALVVGEVALSVVLLAGAGLLLRTFSRLLQVNLGFNTEHVLTARMLVMGERQQRSSLVDRILDRLQALPGVHAAGTIQFLPLGGWANRGPFHLVGEPDPAPEADMQSDVAVVSRGYFAAMGIPILKGRTFSRQDRFDSPRVALVSESFMKRYFPQSDPLGHRIIGDWSNAAPTQIVGVVGDIRQDGLTAEPQPTVYLAQIQSPGYITYMVLRTAGRPEEMAAAVRHAVRDVDSNQPVTSVQGMDEYVSAKLAQPKLYLMLVGAFAILAYVLAGVGLYGLVAYTVSRRRHEIGVRMALGASPRTVMRSVLGQGAALTVVGLAIGIPAAMAMGRFISSWLYGVSHTDPPTFVAVSLILIAVALAACYIPARRAARVDPMVALRYE